MIVEVRNPLDMHVHFRQGAMLKEVVPLTARTFSGALVMPNTLPPITTREDVQRYTDEISAAKQDESFAPAMTLFFRTDYTRKFLESVAPLITAIKLYPDGITTNSHGGVDPNDTAIGSVLRDMEVLGIPLCVHGETKGFVLDREANFATHYDLWAQKFPKLKIIMEHITTKTLADFLGRYENVYATITVHHLMLTLDDVIGGMLEPHHFCKPIAKRPEDCYALRELAFGRRSLTSKKVMLGTDSAPHAKDKKESSCGCAGVFTAPIALQLLAQEFASGAGADWPTALQNFASDNARRIYNLASLPSKTVVLEDTPFQVPELYGEVVPLRAGKQLPWSIKEITK